jgi:hypothetical protein
MRTAEPAQQVTEAGSLSPASEARADPSIPDVIDSFEREVADANARVEALIRTRDTASLDDLMRTRRGTSPRTGFLLATDAAGAPAPHARFYGQAVELEVRRRILENPVLRQFVEQGGYIFRRPAGRTYRGFTDFEINIEDTFLIVDVTTPRDAAAHYERFYGENAVVVTYEIPF